MVMESLPPSIVHQGIYKMIIVCVNDRTVLEMKKEIAAYLEELGYTVIDLVTHSSERCDYPFYGEKSA